MLSLIPLMCSIPGERATAALGISVSMVTETESQAKIAFAFYYPFPTLANESADLLGMCTAKHGNYEASGVWETAVLSQYCVL